MNQQWIAIVWYSLTFSPMFITERSHQRGCQKCQNIHGQTGFRCGILSIRTSCKACSWPLINGNGGTGLHTGIAMIQSSKPIHHDGWNDTNGRSQSNGDQHHNQGNLRRAFSLGKLNNERFPSHRSWGWREARVHLLCRWEEKAAPFIPSFFLIVSVLGRICKGILMLRRHGDGYDESGFAEEEQLLRFFFARFASADDSISFWWWERKDYTQKTKEKQYWLLLMSLFCRYDSSIMQRIWYIYLFAFSDDVPRAFSLLFLSDYVTDSHDRVIIG